MNRLLPHLVYSLLRLKGRNENADEPRLSHTRGIAAPHEIPVDRVVSLEVESKIQGTVTPGPFRGIC